MERSPRLPLVTWRGAVIVVGVLAFLAAFAIDVPHPRWQLLVDISVAGVVVGGIFGLSGLGLVVTYKATGVFNFAHGAVAVVVTYVLWQLVRQWDVPVWAAAIIAIGGVGPLIGAVLAWLVFQPLDRREASVAERLVATLGVFVLLVGACFVVWGPQTKTDPVRLFPSTPLRCGHGACHVPGTHYVFNIGIDQLAIVFVAAVVSTGLWALFRHTWLGMEIRATVDHRSLAELAGINTDRVSAASWAIGCGLAGITGVLLAPVTFGLDPYRLTLLVTETFAVAVLARLSSLSLTMVSGLFLGLVYSYGNVFSFARPLRVLFHAPASAANAAGRLLDPILVSISVFVLFGALLADRRLDEVGDDEAAGLVARSIVGGRARPKGKRFLAAVVALGAVLLPTALGSGEWSYAHSMLALAVVFLSIVAVTGFSGHITLGQAGFAGFGAFMTGRLHAGTIAGLPRLPIVVAMVIAALSCVPLGLLAAYPALRRRGLFLGLTTLALGLVLERYVFQNFYFVAGRQLSLQRPNIVGFALGSDTAFYYFELAVLVLMILLTRNLRSGRLGRVLAAMRDSEVGARSLGINVRWSKLMVFSLSAFMAGLGGSLLAQAAGTFSSATFSSFNSLTWFAAVVVGGVSSISGGLLAAFILTMLGVIAGQHGLATLLVGLAAVLLGRMPGGLVGVVRRATVSGWAPRWLQQNAPAWGRPRSRPIPLEPTPFAQRLLSRTATGDGR